MTKNCKNCGEKISGNYQIKYCFNCLKIKKSESDKRYRERNLEKIRKQKKESSLIGKKRICPVCLKEFERATWLKNKFCSQICHGLDEKINRVGKRNPYWKKGIHPQTYNRIYFDNIYKTKGLLPDEIGCELCGIRTGTIFDRHHIVFKSEKGWHDEISNPLNLIQICRSCHLKLHAQKSRRNDLVSERGLESLFNCKLIS